MTKYFSTIYYLQLNSFIFIDKNLIFLNYALKASINIFTYHLNEQLN